MGLFDNLNQRSTVKAGIDTTEMDFVKLGEFEGEEIMVDGFFFTDGQYGRQVVVVVWKIFQITCQVKLTFCKVRTCL